MSGNNNFSSGSDLEPNAFSDWNSSSPSPASSASSSIGKNSDLSERSSSEEGEDYEENEAQSSYKGPLEMMEALEEVLPMRRGISKFYSGKSKSFASLGDAASKSCIKEITKPENAYTRKRRNLMAFNHVWDQNRGGGISKRPIMSSCRSTLAFAVAMTSSESSCSTNSDESCPRSPPPMIHAKPPISARSMSLADFQ